MSNTVASSAAQRARISEVVRSLRKERGLSQAALARELGLSQNRLSEVERGGGSFTAEQLLTMLRLFNVPLSRFSEIASPRESLQKLLARFGAYHSIEDPDVLPSERLREVHDVVREVILEGSPRLLTAVAPVLVQNARALNLGHIYRDLSEVGRAGRLIWIVENTVHALEDLLARDTESSSTQKRYREALPYLRAFQEVIRSRTVPDDSHLGPDIVDSVRSSQTLKTVEAAATPISKRWNIVSRLQPRDFAAALEDARGAHR